MVSDETLITGIPEKEKAGAGGGHASGRDGLLGIGTWRRPRDAPPTTWFWLLLETR